jgi:hypothetical protein
MGLSKSSDSLHHLRLTIDGLWFHFTCEKWREAMGIAIKGFGSLFTQFTPFSACFW